MIAALLAAPAASAAALAAMGCLAACPLMRARPAMLALQVGAGLSFTAHYALLGVTAATAICALGALQAVAAFLGLRSAPFRLAGWVLIGLMLAAAGWFWNGPASALSAAAMAIIGAARLQADEVRLRSMLVAGALVWAAHDALVASWIALAADALAAGLGVSALAGRDRRVAVLGAA